MMTNCNPDTCPLNRVILSKTEAFCIWKLTFGHVHGMHVTGVKFHEILEIREKLQGGYQPTSVNK